MESCTSHSEPGREAYELYTGTVDVLNYLRNTWESLLLDVRAGAAAVEKAIKRFGQEGAPLQQHFFYQTNHQSKHKSERCGESFRGVVLTAVAAKCSHRWAMLCRSARR